MKRHTFLGEKNKKDCQKTPTIPKLIHESYAMLIKITLRSFCWEKEQNNSIAIIIDGKTNG